MNANAIWQNLTLMTVPFQQWRSASLLHRFLAPVRRWRQGSVLMRWADWIGAGLVMLVFAIAPFVENEVVGVLLAACGAYWLLLTLSDEGGDEQKGERREARGNGETDSSRLSLSQRTSAVLTTPIHALVLLYWSISAVATGVSPVRRAAFTGFTKLTLYLVLFALMARVLRSPRIRNWVITVYLHIGLIVSAYAWQQKFSGVKALATWVDPESPLSQETRVYSYLGNPNLLAGYILPALIFSVVAIFAWQGWLRKALAATMAMVNGACLVWTLSRGGFIGLAISLLVLSILLAHWWSILLPRFWRKWALPAAVGGLAALVILAVIAVPTVRDRVTSMFSGRGDSSNNFRINVWQSVIQMIKARPVLGIGPGNNAFNLIYPGYQKTRFTALSAYSIVLEVAVETGIIGLTCFVWSLVTTFSLGWMQLQKLRTARNADGFWLMGAIATLFGMLGHGLVDTVLYRPQVNTLWWLMIALIASYYTREVEHEPSEP